METEGTVLSRVKEVNVRSGWAGVGFQWGDPVCGGWKDRPAWVSGGGAHTAWDWVSSWRGGSSWDGEGGTDGRADYG